MGLTQSKRSTALPTPPLTPPPSSPATETERLISMLQKSLTDLSSSMSNPDLAPERQRSFAAVQAGFGALEAAMLPPNFLICCLAAEFQISTALALVVDQGFAEIISSGGEVGVSSVEIEALTGMPKGKVSRLLRVLCGRGVFREVKPDVWAHTRHSRVLDSGVRYEDVAKEPIARYANTGSSASAFVYHVTTLGMKHSSAIFEAFRDKKYLKSYRVDETPFNWSTKTDRPYWEWLETEEGGIRTKTFMNAMTVNQRQSDFSRYPWSDLGPNAVLVDVGGGNGSTVAAILPHATNITKTIVQDRPQVIESAKKVWKSSGNESDTVDFQAHDFFTPQPVKGAQAYFMRCIMHDWSDEECVTILKQLRDAAAEHSRLLVLDTVVAHACHELGDAAVGAVPGAYDPPLPAPLPANGGKATEFDLTIDLQMMNLLNGQERTFLELTKLAAEAGWKATRVVALDGTSLRVSEFTVA